MKAKMILASCALVLAACSGGDNNEHHDNNGHVHDMANNGSADMAANNGGADMAANNGAADMAANNGAGEDMGSGGDDMSSGADMATGDDMGTADMAEPARLEAHGCTFATATDMTGMAAVSITDIEGWTIGHNVCLIVSTGTVVSWSGNFTSHPLDGGVSGSEDTTNPIDMAGQGVNGNSTVDVTFDAAGDYPYYCSIHVGAMNGVVYVVD